MAREMSVRVIGGTHRGRKIRFPEAPGLRPTPDRVRETLFNWLQGALPGASVLDAFAGTGILGLEALSRGAESALFVEQNSATQQALAQRCLEWDLPGRVIHSSFARLGDAGPFDVIFLDPPFGQNLLPDALAQARTLLKPDGLIAVEHEAGFEFPDGFEVLKSTRAGAEHLALVEVS